MSDKTDTAVESGVASFLHPGESVYAILIASVRGHQQAMVGGVAGMIGGGRAGKARQAAESVGINLTSPMAFVLTHGRLVTVQTGNRGKVIRLLNEFELSEAESVDVKRVGLGASVTLRIRGVDVKLESRVSAARAFAEEFDRVKGDPL